MGVASSRCEHLRDAEPVSTATLNRTDHDAPTDGAVPGYLAVIPSIGRSRFTPALLDTLARDGLCERIVVIDNEPGLSHCLRRNDWINCTPAVMTAYITGRLALVKSPETTIYGAWNYGMDVAAAEGWDCAVLNDDIVLPDGSIRQAQRLLDDACPLVGLNYGPGPGVGDHGFKLVSGTFKDGGIGGFAFVVAPDAAPRVHPGFRWWYGDDDLMRRVSAMGGQLRIAFGAPVAHPEPSTSGNQMDWRLDAIAADEALFRELWG